MTDLTVVCPLSGIAAAERALPSAVDAARLFDASLELFSAVEDPHMVARRSDYLEATGADTFGRNPGALTVEVVVDPHAPRALASRAANERALVVMATSSQPLMHTGYVGSAAERVAREATNPVLLVGPHAHIRLGDAERVVVPCDGSQLSELILLEAADWAQRLDVELWVVTALSPRVRGRIRFDAESESNYVRRLAGKVDAQWDVLHGPDPARAIVEWAGPSLIAMTTHGRSGLSRLTLGSVAVATTRWAEGPVLISNANRSLENPS